MNGPHPSVTVECYARAAPRGPSVEVAVETLRDYRDRGVVDELSLAVWPDEVVVEGYAADGPLLSRYRRFRAWAEDAGVSLGPGFAVRERGSLVEDRTDALLVLPECCLAVRVDGELRTVAPHRVDGTVYTVEDALADLGRSGRERPTPPSRAGTGTDGPARPVPATERSE